MPMIPNPLQSLNTAVLSDTLDSLALMQQAMRPFMRPLDDTLQLIGRARTGVYMPVYAPPAKGENPYEVEIALVDDLAPGDVVVLACDGPPERIAPWGELLSTASRARGAAGCVTDGLVLAVWIASAAFAAVDESLEQAARNLGAGPWRCFTTITLPLAAPGLIASAIFVFLESLDEFTGTYFVGVPDVITLPLLMFNASMGGNYQIASITALLLLVPSIGFMLLVERFLKADVLAMVGR